MTVTDVVAVLGLMSGVTGTVLGVLSHLRDRARVEVGLQWDMAITGEPGVRVGIITVTNVGRRPVHVSHVALRLPDGRFDEASHLLLRDGITGKTLPEGSPSEIHIVTYDGMEKFASAWHLIRAQVSDSTGRQWISKYVSKKPSWAAAWHA